MKAKHIFIQPETDAALSKLGGANRAENLRRAVALAECADELAIQLEGMINFASGLEMDLYGEAKEVDEDALAALTNYRSTKQ